MAWMHFETGPFGLENVDVYSRVEAYRPPFSVADGPAKQRERWRFLRVRNARNNATLADAYHPGGKELEAAKEWLLNLCLLRAEGGE